MYRLYLDESGDHTVTPSDELGKRYLGLIGVAFEEDADREFRVELDGLKREYLRYEDPRRPPVLHRTDIVQRRGPFLVLQDPAVSHAWDADLLHVIARADFRVIAVVIDKVEHGDKHYRELKHPYHYCMQAMLERYCGWLDFSDNRGDVLAESRGGTEDRLLAQAYSATYADGGTYLPREQVQRTLTSSELKIAPKKGNVAGSQLADLLARDLTREVLMAYGRIDSLGGPFAERIVEVVLPKYNRRSYDGRINGYGRKFLT